MHSSFLKSAAGLLLAPLVFAAAPLAWGTAQAPQDFSGGWVATKDAPTGIAAAPTPVFGARFWLESSGNNLTVIRAVRDTAVAAKHVVGGPEVRSRVPGATCHGDTTAITRIEREGDGIVHHSVSTVPPGVTTPVPNGLRHVIRRVGPDRLVVETTMRTSAQSTERTAVATVYQRTSDAPPPILAPVAPPAAATLSQMGWLTGTWATEGASLIEERWTPAVGGAMLGTSRTVRNNSMSAFEFLCIAERHNGLVYTAMPNGRTPATDFQLTAIDATSATFENPTHDFPKKIRYALRPDGMLEAVISGPENQKPITFVFKKQ